MTQEMILAVKRSTLFSSGAWHGLQTVDWQQYRDCIMTHQEFHPRASLEQDPTYKQIIPYLIFTHEQKYFLMERRSTASEQRLQGKVTLGIGGHVRQEDITSASLFDWARREFHEEVDYDGALDIQVLGILNDDSNDVGKVHVGLVLLLCGNSGNISVKSELKGGTLCTLQECLAIYDRMESWSQIALEHLCTTYNKGDL